MQTNIILKTKIEKAKDNKQKNNEKLEKPLHEKDWLVGKENKKSKPIKKQKGLVRKKEIIKKKEIEKTSEL